MENMCPPKKLGKKSRDTQNKSRERLGRKILGRNKKNLFLVGITL
jgi:hypothetical protein